MRMQNSDLDGVIMSGSVPETFFGEKHDVFVNKIEPNGMTQGELGDCYFLSALSSLAETPNRIRKIFVSKERNSVGCYCVRICVVGEWREIIVDDLFPCNKFTMKPVFTTSSFQRALGSYTRESLG